MFLRRIARTLVLYREAVLWYALVAAATVMMATAGTQPAHPLPAQPQALPPLRTAGPPPTVPPTLPPTLPPTTGTVPPTTGTAPPPTPTRSATTSPPATDAPTRPGQVGEPQGEPALEPPPPTSVPPTTSGPTPTPTPTPTTAGPPPTTTTIPQTTAPTVAEVVCVRPGPTSAATIKYKGPPLTTHLADGHVICRPTH